MLPHQAGLLKAAPVLPIFCATWGRLRDFGHIRQLHGRGPEDLGTALLSFFPISLMHACTHVDGQAVGSKLRSLVFPVKSELFSTWPQLLSCVPTFLASPTP